MVQLAQRIVLNEVDAEVVAIGSMLMQPESFDLNAAGVSPGWFSEPFLRYVFEHCQKLKDAGHTLSRTAVLGALPDDCGGMSRAAFYAKVASAAVPPQMLGGVTATLKDRWARRELVATAELMKDRASIIGEDPFLLAQEAVLSLDTVNASRISRGVGTMQTATGALMSSLERPEAMRGATTGLRALDKKLNGYRAGQLYVFAGRPGMGKSAFMVSSMRRTAAAGFGVAIFSLEMTGEEIAARAVSDALDSTKAPKFGDILKGLISQDEQEDVARTAAGMDSLPLHIDDSSRLSFSEIAARARTVQAKLEAEGRFLAVLCIDHMGLVTPSDRYRGNKVAEAGEVSGQARALAKELNCCVVLLCQLSREVEKRDDKKPVMADLRWSGEIEQDAHVVAFLYREYYYLQSDAKADPGMAAAARNRLEFLIRKNRNGETSDVQLWCSIAHSSVRDE